MPLVALMSDLSAPKEGKILRPSASGTRGFALRLCQSHENAARASQVAFFVPVHMTCRLYMYPDLLRHSAYMHISKINMHLHRSTHTGRSTVRHVIVQHIYRRVYMYGRSDDVKILIRLSECLLLRSNASTTTSRNVANSLFSCLRTTTRTPLIFSSSLSLHSRTPPPLIFTSILPICPPLNILARAWGKLWMPSSMCSVIRTFPRM